MAVLCCAVDVLRSAVDVLRCAVLCAVLCRPVVFAMVYRGHIQPAAKDTDDDVVYSKQIIVMKQTHLQTPKHVPVYILLR